MSVALEIVDDAGSKGPSITAIVGTASSSSNSLHIHIDTRLFRSDSNQMQGPSLI